MEGGVQLSVLQLDRSYKHRGYTPGSSPGIVGQIKSVSHKNLSVDGTSSKFGIHVLQDPFSQKSTLPTLKNKMAAIFQDGRHLKWFESVFELNYDGIMLF